MGGDRWADDEAHGYCKVNVMNLARLVILVRLFALFDTEACMCVFPWQCRLLLTRCGVGITNLLHTIKRVSRFGLAVRR